MGIQNVCKYLKVLPKPRFWVWLVLGLEKIPWLAVFGLAVLGWEPKVFNFGILRSISRPINYPWGWVKP